MDTANLLPGRASAADVASATLSVNHERAIVLPIRTSSQPPSPPSQFFGKSSGNGENGVQKAVHSPRAPVELPSFQKEDKEIHSLRSSQGQSKLPVEAVSNCKSRNFKLLDDELGSLPRKTESDHQLSPRVARNDEEYQAEVSAEDEKSKKKIGEGTSHDLVDSCISNIKRPTMHERRKQDQDRASQRPESKTDRLKADLKNDIALILAQPPGARLAELPLRTSSVRKIGRSRNSHIRN
ncbi:hypothetical protein CC80DRAFT_577965 [Byssothecium circinans]|uniref:Uncharacterized protein n=1 Tax=Byssothecium circinans TaxID=147558 RepID=A0A6A5UBV3_9PLEO|nr:hypothetical protein CC80DRAFT_577965 [Byssothecium circinans]